MARVAAQAAVSSPSAARPFRTGVKHLGQLSAPNKSCHTSFCASLKRHASDELPARGNGRNGSGKRIAAMTRDALGTKIARLNSGSHVWHQMVENRSLKMAVGRFGSRLYLEPDSILQVDLLSFRPVYTTPLQMDENNRRH